MQPLDPRDLSLESFAVARPTALITLDLEPDYGGRGQAGLDRLGELLRHMRSLGAPLTAFVEGRLFAARPELCRALVEAGAEVQLHCYDHTRPGDTPATLAQGVAAYTACMGVAPEGYRANGFRLTRELYAALLDLGFKWDSSILPGIGLGANRAPAFRRGDYFRLDGRLVEFPVATWRGLPLPFTHAYRRLIRPAAEAALRRFCALPRLVVYDMHMVDLVRTGSLAGSPLPAYLKALYRLSWRAGESDSFASLTDAVEFLRARGYVLTTAGALYRAVAHVAAPAA